MSSTVMTLYEREELIRWRSELLCEIARGKPLDDTTRKVYQWALELDSHNAPALNALGCIAMKARHFANARRYFEAAAVVAPQDARIPLNAAVACDFENRLDEAEHLAYRALEVDPQSASAYLMLVQIAERRERPDLLGRAIGAGLSAKPEDSPLLFARACMRLKRGDFKSGWADYEHRPGRIEMLEKLDDVSEWRGESLEGKTLLIAGEQGFGDQVMFARYLSKLPPARDIVVYTRPDLARLFASYHVVTSDRELVALDVDYWVLMGSLPHVLQLDKPLTAAFPIPVSAEHIERYRHLFPETGNLRVGLAWSGNPEHYRDRERSIAFEQLQELLEVPGCDFYSLQYGDTTSGLVNLTSVCHDWLDNAAAISHLDLVIAVDTGMAHLTASMGKPTWILVPKPNEWRWGLHSSGGPSLTIWYGASTMVFAQRNSGDWHEVILRVKNELASQVDLERRPLATSIDNTRPCPTTSRPSEDARGRATSPEINDERPDSLGLCRTILRRTCRYGEMNFLANDHYIGRAIDLYGEYSESEARLLSDLLEPGDGIIEAGANIGGLTVAIGERVGPLGCVYAFEPQPEYFKLLEKNVASRPQIAPFRAALGSVATEIVLRDIEIETIYAPGWPATGPEHTVQQFRIDTLDLIQIALIKIDVDGQELEILQGAEQTIADWQPLLYVEYDKPERYPDLLPWLEQHGYRIYTHNAPLFNPQNFAGYPVNVFGGLVSGMLLAVPRGRYLEQSLIDRHSLDRLRMRKTIH